MCGEGTGGGWGRIGRGWDGGGVVRGRDGWVEGCWGWDGWVEGCRRDGGDDYGDDALSVRFDRSAAGWGGKGFGFSGVFADTGMVCFGAGPGKWDCRRCAAFSRWVCEDRKA